MYKLVYKSVSPLSIFTVSSKSKKFIFSTPLSVSYLPRLLKFQFSASRNSSLSFSSSTCNNSLPNLIPMNHWTVITAVAPIVQEHLKDVSFLDVYASLVALKNFQNRQNGKHRIEKLPGKAAMVNTALDSILLSNAFRMCKYATATYGWMGHLFFWLTDPDTSRGFTTLSKVAKSTLTGDTDAFLTIASITRDQLLFSSSSVQIGIPKHFIIVDDNLRAIVLTIRGTMSLADALTDALAREIPFCGGYAHEGIAFAAKHIYESTRELIEQELAKRPGYTLMITGHSLGAATAMLYTILVHYERQCSNTNGTNMQINTAKYPFPRVDIECHAFAAPPVFSPLSVLPSSVSSSIISWVHREDIIPRLTLQGIRDLIRLCKKISAYHPSLTGRLLKNDIELRSILESEPEWLGSWNSSDQKLEKGSTTSSTSSIIPSENTNITARGAKTIVDDQHLSKDMDRTNLQKEDDELLEELQEVRTIVKKLQSQSYTPSNNDVIDNNNKIPPPSSISTLAQNEIPRFQIPGTIFCFRAPIEDIGANKGTINTTYSTTSTSSSFFSINPNHPFTKNILTSPITMVSSWVNNTTEFLESTVNTISTNMKNIVKSSSTSESELSANTSSSSTSKYPADIIIPDSPTSASSSSSTSSVNTNQESQNTNINNKIMNNDRLIPEITEQAIEKSKIDKLPYITVCTADDLRNLPITDTAWRDHVPDQYLFVLRQLMEIAVQQQQENEQDNNDNNYTITTNSKELSSNIPNPPVNPDIRHLHVGNGNVIRISKDAEQKGQSKETNPSLNKMENGPKYSVPSEE